MKYSEDMKQTCIQQNYPAKTYDLQFFPNCNDDEVVRDDLKDIFFNDPDYLDYYDIKVFSQTPKDDYDRILDGLEKNLATRTKIIHMSNAAYWLHDWWKGYEEFSVNAGMFNRILDIIFSSPHQHGIEIHVKRKDYQEWNTDDHNKTIENIIKRVENASNILSLVINEGITIDAINDKDKEIYYKEYLQYKGRK